MAFPLRFVLTTRSHVTGDPSKQCSRAGLVTYPTNFHLDLHPQCPSSPVIPASHAMARRRLVIVRAGSSVSSPLGGSRRCFHENRLTRFAQNMLSVPLDPVYQGLLVFFGRECQSGGDCWTGGGCSCDCESGIVLVVEEEEGELDFFAIGNRSADTVSVETRPCSPGGARCPSQKSRNRRLPPLSALLSSASLRSIRLGTISRFSASRCTSVGRDSSFRPALAVTAGVGECGVLRRERCKRPCLSRQRDDQPRPESS